MGVACTSQIQGPDPRASQPPVDPRNSENARIQYQQSVRRNPNYGYKGSAHIPPPERIDPDILRNTGYNILWNQNGWLDYEQHEENSPDLFHKKIDDYIAVLERTPGLDRNAKWRVQKFLTGKYLYPVFQKPRPAKRQLNYYRLLWYILHSLPFYVLKYDARTVSALSYFFADIATTHPCNVCSTHMAQYLKDNAFTGSSLAELVVWMCNFHNHLNTETGKPWFDCTKYAKRWGIKMSKVSVPPPSSAPSSIASGPVYTGSMAPRHLQQQPRAGPFSAPTSPAMGPAMVARSPANTNYVGLASTNLRVTNPQGNQVMLYPYEDDQKSARSSQNSAYSDQTYLRQRGQPALRPRGQDMAGGFQPPPQLLTATPQTRRTRVRTAPNLREAGLAPRPSAAAPRETVNSRVSAAGRNRGTVTASRASKRRRPKYRSIDEIPMFPE